jgi:hypothetical protein
VCRIGGRDRGSSLGPGAAAGQRSWARSGARRGGRDEEGDEKEYYAKLRSVKLIVALSISISTPLF